MELLPHALRQAYRHSVKAILCAILLLSTNSQLLAQGRQHLNPGHASTYDWSVQARLQLLDESHAHREQFYDRGFTRVLTPLVKREYELDMWMVGHQFNESFTWHQNPLGYRMHFGSYSKGRWAVFSQLHTGVELGSNSDFLINFYPQQHARGARALVEFGYQHAFGPHKVSLSHTLSEFKQDLDLTLGYEGTGESWGRFELDFTVMNHLNNVVNVAGNDSEQVISDKSQIQTTQRNFPAFFAGRYRTPPDLFYHLDFSFGWQPRRRDSIYDKFQPAYRFTQMRKARYLNASFDVKNDFSTLGVFFYMDRDRLKRSGESELFNGVYSAAQKTQKHGGFWYGYFGRIRPFVRLSHERYWDKQWGDNFSISLLAGEMNYEESRLILDAGINVQPFKLPFFIEGRYMSMKRNTIDVEASKQITKQWTDEYIFIVPHNNRLVYSFSFIASERFHFEVGGAYDIDGDLHPSNPDAKRFDKGFGKVIAWF